MQQDEVIIRKGIVHILDGELGYPVYPSQANYVFFTGPADLYEKLEQKKILIRDCSNYTGLSKGYYRVAVKEHEENQQLVKALKEIERNR